MEIRRTPRIPAAFIRASPPTNGPMNSALSSSGNSSGNSGAAGLDWTRWLRLIERKRRLLHRRPPGESNQHAIPMQLFASVTQSSFQLDGIDVPLPQIEGSLARGYASKSFRSRVIQRVRNHVAILTRIASSVRLGQALKCQTVIRWYTSISCGLSTAQLDEPTLSRLDSVVRRINSPQLRLQPALNEVVRLHCQLLADPFVPSFNGILARLMLEYHLGRCGLPQISFSQGDAVLLRDENRLLGRILEMIDSSYTFLLAS